MKNLIFSIYFFLLFFSFYQKSLSQTPNNFNGWFPDREVRTISSDDNYIYLGGDFTSFTKKGVKGSNTQLAFFKEENHNALSENFSQFIKGEIIVAISDNRGGWYIGGNFELKNKPNYVSLLHINADNTIDYNWNMGLSSNDFIKDLFLVGDDLYVNGKFEKIGGQNRKNFAKISIITSSVVDNWVINTNYVDDYEYGAKFYALGDYIYIYGSGSGKMRRFSVSNGDVDTSWEVDYGYNGDLSAVVGEGNNLYVGGDFRSINGQFRRNIAKLSTTNTGNNILDNTWNITTNNQIKTLSIFDGNLYVGGYFSEIGNQQKTLIARISISTNTVDTNWNPNLQVQTNSNQINTSFVEKIVILNNNVYAVGIFQDATFKIQNFIKISNSGNIDFNWNPNINFDNYYSDCVLSISNDKILLTGELISFNGVRRNNLARIKKSNMELDLEWNPIKNEEFILYDTYINVITIKNNFLYVGGKFRKINGQERNCLARFTTIGEGILDIWNPKSTDCLSIYNIVASETDIFVSGHFHNIGGQNREGVAKIPIIGDGSADNEWNAKLRAYGTGYHNRLYIAGNYLYILGDFYGIDTQSWGTIVRVSVIGSGQADYSWKPLCSYAQACEVTNDYTYISGQITNPKTNNVQSVARVSNTTGQLDKDWIPPIYGYISSMRVISDSLYIAGYFTINQENPRADTALYQSFAKISISENKFDNNWSLRTKYISKYWRNTTRPSSVEKMIIDGHKVYAIGDFSYFSIYKIPYFVIFNLQDTLSTDDYLASSIKVYPNPVRDIVNIDVADAQYNNFKVTLLGGDGKMIQDIEAVTQPEGFKMDISKLPAGLYFLRLESKNAKIIKRIVKL